MGERNSEGEGLDARWKCTKDIIHEAPKKVGFKPKERRREWFDQECEEVLSKKNKAYKEYLQRQERDMTDIASSERKSRRYVDVRSESSTIIFYILLNIEEGFGSNNLKTAYRQVNRIKERYKPRTSLYKDKEGEIISGSSEIRARWAHVHVQVTSRSTLKTEMRKHHHLPWTK